jgi:transcription-repair coupling factor (superfamily II helicase)
MKQLRLEVDTLAMTATPIPRTLHLSLAGARDLSIIDTPPEDRYPVQTYVLEYSESLVREAIGRELNRQGQIFLVFNRVERIDAFAEKIQQMFPETSVAVGHGQMPELKLEKVMADFQDGKHQILISTTIIESGLDIPNVNTLIIYEADRFGLAQLYQIRGRVGRSNRVAYAYLTYRKDKMISETAQKRLRVIKEFTELGSGFKIALRDLEIRGAGNILGAEQHGFIAAVGFDLYVKLLDQAVAKYPGLWKEPLILPICC